MRVKCSGAREGVRLLGRVRRPCHRVTSRSADDESRLVYVCKPACRGTPSDHECAQLSTGFDVPNDNSAVSVEREEYMSMARMEGDGLDHLYREIGCG